MLCKCFVFTGYTYPSTSGTAFSILAAGSSSRAWSSSTIFTTRVIKRPSTTPTMASTKTTITQRHGLKTELRFSLSRPVPSSPPMPKKMRKNDVNIYDALVSTYKFAENNRILKKKYRWMSYNDNANKCDYDLNSVFVTTELSCYCNIMPLPKKSRARMWFLSFNNLLASDASSFMEMKLILAIIWICTVM